MSNWDDDFWSDDEATTSVNKNPPDPSSLPSSDSIIPVVPTLDRTTSTHSFNASQPRASPPQPPPLSSSHDSLLPQLASLPSYNTFGSNPDLSNRDIDPFTNWAAQSPPLSNSSGSQISQFHNVGSSASASVSGTNDGRSIQNVDPLSSPSSTVSPDSGHSIPNVNSSRSWGWSSLAAKVTSSAAHFILMPENQLESEKSIRPATTKPPAFSDRAAARSSSSTLNWFESVASVIENVKTTAGQSGRELIQVAADALVKKPEVVGTASEDNPARLRPQTHPSFVDQTRGSTTAIKRSASPGRRSHVPVISTSQTHSVSPTRHSENHRSGQISPFLESSNSVSTRLSLQRSPITFSPQSHRTHTVNTASWDEDWLQNDGGDVNSSSCNDLNTPTHLAGDHHERKSSGWLQDVIEGVRVTAAQSGHEILQVSGVLTSEMLLKAKSIVPDIKAQKSLVPISSVDVSHSPMRSPTFNQIFSTAQTISASDNESIQDSDSGSERRNRPVTAGKDQDLKIFPDDADSDAEQSEFSLNFPEHSLDGPSQSFDTLLEVFGCSELICELEQLSRESSIRFEKCKLRLDSSVLERIDQISNIVSEGEPKQESKSSLISNITSLTKKARVWHLNLIEDYINNAQSSDIFVMFDRIHSICTRTLAILTSKCIDILTHSVRQWTGDIKYAFSLANTLRTFFCCFENQSKCLLVSTIDVVQRWLSSSGDYVDDIDILYADIEVDVFDARFKIQDALESIVPVLKCMALSLDQ